MVTQQYLRLGLGNSMFQIIVQHIIRTFRTKAYRILGIIPIGLFTEALFQLQNTQTLVAGCIALIFLRFTCFRFSYLRLGFCYRYSRCFRCSGRFRGCCHIYRLQQHQSQHHNHSQYKTDRAFHHWSAPFKHQYAPIIADKIRNCNSFFILVTALLLLILL